MSKVNSIEKFLAILELLSQNPNGITAKDIRDKMEDLGYDYSIRSAQKDIESFETSRALIDIIVVERRERKKILKLKDSNLVVKTVVDKLRYDFIKENLITSISAEQKRLLDGFDNYKFLKLTGFNADKSAPSLSNVGKIMFSIKDRRYISFKYKRSGIEDEKNIKNIENLKPYRIIVDNDGWYLLSQFEDEEFMRVFLIDFIDDIKISEKNYEALSDSEMEEIDRVISQSKCIWYLTAKKVNVEAVLDKKIARKVKEMEEKGVSYFADQKILKENEDGSILISFKVGDDSLYQVDFKRQVYPWLPDIKIISPKKYKDFLKNDLMSIVNE